MSIYGVIGYHVTLSEGHMIANHHILRNTCAPSCGNFDLFVTNLFILYIRGDMSPLPSLIFITKAKIHLKLSTGDERKLR